MPNVPYSLTLRYLLRGWTRWAEAPAGTCPLSLWITPLQDADESAAKQKLKDSAAAHLKKFYEVGCTRGSGAVHLCVAAADLVYWHRDGLATT